MSEDLEKCPKCQSKKITYHLWGYPNFDFLEEAKSRGITVIVEGCVPNESDINYRFPYCCNDCNHRWKDDREDDDDDDWD